MAIKASVASALQRALGKYVDGLNAEALSLSIWSGKAELSGLSLKTAAINELHLPIQCESGSIGRVVVSIPWKNLWGAPVAVEISDVSLLLRRRSRWDWDMVSQKQCSVRL